MPVDPTTLMSTVRRLAKSADLRRRKSITATIRPLLPEIRRLREENIPWSVIAAGLAQKGVTEGDGNAPLSERRLTSIVAKLKAQAETKAARETMRQQRGDVAAPRPLNAEPPTPPRSQAPRLAPELADRPPVHLDDAPLSEAEIRRTQYEKHQHLFKKD